MNGRKCRKGFIAVIALLIMAILLMFGVTFLTMATTENTMVTNGINGQVAFNIAEAGIDHAKRVLLGADLTTVIQNNQTNPFLNQISFASGTYTVNVTNNCSAADNRCTNIAVPGATLDTGGPTNDTDLRVVVESTGTYRTAVKKVRALIEIPAILNPPSSIYTLNGPGSGSPPRDVTDFDFDGNSFLVQGQDTNPGLTTLAPGGAAVPGVGVMACSTCDSGQTPLQEANGALNPNHSQDDNITGQGGDPSITVPPSTITASYLTTLKSYLTAHATPANTYTGNTTIEGTSTIGTPAAPQITVVNGELKLKGSASGFGILLVTGEFEMEGTATFQGIILVDGNGEVELKGSAKIWGAIIHINRTSSDSGKTKLEIEGNAQVYYSRQAIQNAGGTLSPTTLAWSERT